MGISQGSEDLCCCKFEPWIRKTWPCNRWHDRTPYWAVLLILLNFEKILISNILICMFIFLKFKPRIERSWPGRWCAGRPPSSSATDTYKFRKIFQSLYYEKQQIWLADNPKTVSEEHNHDRGGTTGHPVERLSWYRRFSKKLWVGISPGTEDLCGCKFEHFGRRTGRCKRMHDGTRRPVNILIQTIFEKNLCGYISRYRRSVLLNIQKFVSAEYDHVRGGTSGPWLSCSPDIVESKKFGVRLSWYHVSLSSWKFKPRIGRTYSGRGCTRRRPVEQC